MPRELDFYRELVYMFNQIRYEWRNNPLILGGSSGSGGGSGTTPGGISGLLSQRYVAGDSDEFRILTSGSVSSLLDNLDRIRYWETTQISSSEPSPTFAGQLWQDTTYAPGYTPLKIRNVADDDWINTGTGVYISGTDAVSGLIHLVEGDNITIEQSGNDFTFNATVPPSGVTSIFVSGYEPMTGSIELLPGDGMVLTPIYEDNVIVFESTGSGGGSSGSTFATRGDVLFVGEDLGATEDSTLFFDATNKRLQRGLRDFDALAASFSGLGGILNINTGDGSAMVAMAIGSGTPSFSGFNIGGSPASPSATVAGKNIARLGGRGWGSTALASGNRAEINFTVPGDWTGTSQPSTIVFKTTGSGSTTLTTQMTIGDDGVVALTQPLPSASGGTGGYGLINTVFTTSGSSNFFSPYTILQANSVKCIGDSLTYAGIYETELQSLLGSEWLVVAQGVNGDTTLDVLARLAADVINGLDCKYCIVFAGIMDVLTDRSAGAIESTLSSIYSALNSYGISTVAVTITPFKTHDSWTSGRQTVLDAVNAWIVGSSGADYIIDAYTGLEDSGAADTLLAAYDGGDHLHLSTAGYNELATLIHSGVTWTLDTTSLGLTLTRNSTLNQNLRDIDTPTFHSLTLSSELTARAVNVTGNASGVGLAINSSTAIRDANYSSGADSLYFDFPRLIFRDPSQGYATVARLKNGYLGIGIDPDYPVDVYGSASDGTFGFRMWNASPTNAGVNFTMIGDYSQFIHQAGHMNFAILDSTGYITFRTNVSTEYMRLDSNGYLGINTTLTGAGVTYKPLSVKGAQVFVGDSSVQEREMGLISSEWNSSTDASRKADLVLSAYDTAVREGIRIRGAGSAAAISFYGATPQTLQTGVAVSAAGIHAALVNLGLITA